jgi:ABC-type amino acid transport substrate-binding protein
MMRSKIIREIVPRVPKRNARAAFFNAVVPLTPFIIFIIAMLFLTGCRQKDDSWQRIQREGVLHVGVDPTFPPFEATADSDVIGLDVDLAHALADEMGLEVNFVYFGYDGLYDALITEQVDVLISALVIVPGRMRDFAYSEAYFNAGEILVTPSSSPVEEMEGLDRKKLAVELGAQGHVEATQWAKRLPDLSVLPYPSADEALDAVAAGEADAALVDGVSGRLYLKEHNDLNLKRASQPVTVEPYAMVVRIEDETLLTRLDEALASVTATGELEKLVERWLGA